MEFLMHRYIFIILFIFLSITSFVNAKTGFVNLRELFEGFYKTELAQDQINQQIEEVSFERELRLEDISQIREEIENLRSESRDEKLSEEARKNKRLQLEDRLIEMQEVQKELRDFETLRKKQIDEQNKRMQKGLLDEIQAEIIKYGDENGYDVIIDRSAKSSLGTEIVLFVGLRSDVTAFILQRLNKGYNNFTE
jgi:outer membrane protein